MTLTLTLISPLTLTFSRVKTQLKKKLRGQEVRVNLQRGNMTDALQHAGGARGAAPSDFRQTKTKECFGHNLKSVP